jgi:hypothetical protein
LRKRRWTEADLEQRRKTDAKKVQLEARLRRETLVSSPRPDCPRASRPPSKGLGIR